MKTYHQFLTTPFSEEVTPEPPEPAKEDPSMKSKEKRQMQIKKQVLLKKMQAVRAGAGADIVAGYEPEGEVLDEADPRLAIYQSGMTDASRVKGRVGKAVDKVKDKVKKVLGKKDKVSSHLDRYRFQSGLDNYLKSKVKKEEVANEDYYSGTGEKVQKRTKAWMGKQKPPIKGAPGLDAMKAREAEHKAKRGVKKEEVVTERLGGKGYKARTDSRGIKVSGDWEDSDRGAGNKAKKRAGGKVEKKSPTYQAHVLHKEDKALAFVIDKLRKQYPGGVLTKGDKMPEPSAAQKKKNAEIRAQRAKEDGRDETEKATSGRYNDRSRSD